MAMEEMTEKYARSIESKIAEWDEATDIEYIYMNKWSGQWLIVQ